MPKQTMQSKIENALTSIIDGGKYGAQVGHIWLNLKDNIVSMYLGKYTNTQESSVDIDLADPKSIDDLMEYIEIHGPITSIALAYDVTTDSSDDGKEWGEWESHSEVHGVSAKLNSTKYSSDVYFYPGIVSKGDTMHVLTAIYGQGDSFGYATGEHELIGVYPSSVEAVKARMEMEKHNKCNEYQNNYAPWDDYFGSLEHYRIDEVRLK